MPAHTDDLARLDDAWARLDSRFDEVKRVFPDLWREAQAILSAQGRGLAASARMH